MSDMSERMNKHPELRLIKKLALEIEQVAEDGQFPENQLQKLILLLSALEHTEEPELQKLSLIKDHLHPKMTLRHFQNFMIPVERLLGRSVREDEFLVTSRDETRKKPQKFPLVFVLENIRSAFNVGSIFRLADAIGVEAVHLVGYTPQPDSKTALGTETTMSFQSYSRLEDAILQLKNQNYKIWALETAENSQSLFEAKFEGPTALVVGNERFGLEPQTLRLMDGVLTLPMSGIKNSLNVSNALSAAAFEWKRQWLSHTPKGQL
jgi:23S rRNA (guanosine2251-2'-O)-methyltransferase